MLKGSPQTTFHRLWWQLALCEVLLIGGIRGILGDERKEGELHFWLSVLVTVSPARVDSGLHFPTPFDTPRGNLTCPCRESRAYHQPWHLGRGFLIHWASDSPRHLPGDVSTCQVSCSHQWSENFKGPWATQLPPRSPVSVSWDRLPRSQALLTALCPFSADLRYY